MKILEGKNMDNINTVKFYEYFHTENEFCIVMELCDENLLQKLSRKEANKGFNIDEIYNILNQLNNSFRIMKENNIIHRDLKLQNILVKYTNKEKTDYILKLSDFGISKHLLTFTKKLSTQIGTMNTMAPEVLKGEKYNAKCDLWSLGIVIYHLYFHKQPYNGTTEIAILNQIKNLNKIISKRIDDYDLKDLVIQLLQPNPSKRITWDDYFNHPFFYNHNNNKENEIIINKKIKSINDKNIEKEKKIIKKDKLKKKFNK